MPPKLLSVDPEQRGDEHYRYKMPEVVTKIEGSGNGIKTVIPNINDIARMIYRPPEALRKFFGFELGAQATHMKKEDKFLVMGQFTAERMQEIVFKFIVKYVLCKKCRNPETYVVNEQKKPLILQCKSCGEKNAIEPGDKMYNMFSILFPPGKPADAATKKAAPKAAAGEEVMNVPSASAHVDPAPVAACANVPESHGNAKPVSSAPKENPIKVLSGLIHDGVPFDTVVATVFRLRTDCGLPDNFSVRLAFRAIIYESEKTGPPPKFIGFMQKQLPLLQRFADGSENQQILIQELQMFCAKHPGLIEKLPMALKMLFEEGILAESEIVDWYDKKNQASKVQKETAEEMHRISAPFIAWLRT